jgi:hypothetical protein
VNNGGFAAPLPFTPANRFLTARVYSTRPVGTLIMLKVEQGTAPAQNSEKSVATTVQNAWETLVFDFGANTGGNPLNYSGVDYDKLSVFCNFNQVGTASANTFYIDDVKFVPGPSVTSFSPTSAAQGTTVTITGNNLDDVTAVSFGGTPAASFTIVSSTQIDAVVAAGTSGSVSVTNPVGSSSLAGFDFIAPPGAPTILTFFPASSIVGGLVTLSGSNFNTATAVTFGGTPASSYTIVNSSTIQAIVGPGSTGSVSVTNGFGTGSRAGFTFLKKPIALPVLWDDFATVNYSTAGDFCGLASALSTDPLNASNTVMRLTKTTVSAACAGTTFGNGPLQNPIPFALGNTKISVRFYSPVANLPVLLKLEGNAGPIEKLETASVVGWQIIEFDFAASANLSDIYNRLVFFPGFNQIAGATQVSYVDNIVFGGFPTNVWVGNTSSDFLNGSNWSLGFPPLDCSQNVQINGNTPFSPVLTSGSYSGGNLTIVGNATFTINSGATYSLCGNLSGPVSGDGTLNFTGTAGQTVGSVQNLNNMTITKPAASGDVTINGTVKVRGVLTLANGNSDVVVAPGGSLVLVSTATGTGSIAALPAGAAVTGNVTQQRYLPGTGSGWYLLGTPIQGGNFSQWTDNMYMAAGSSLGGTQGVLALGIQHSSIFKYDESLHNIVSDTVQKRGWRVPESGDALSMGQGFRVWLKASETPSRTIDNVGTINSGDFNFPTLGRTEPANCQVNISPATIACTEDFRGWNLLSNPYPSAINWDATGGAWVKPASMVNAFWRWNSIGGGYGVYTGGGSYVGAGPVPASPNLIPSSQGFFVKLSTPGVYTATLSIKENAKFNGSGTMLRTNVDAANVLKIKLEKPSANSPYCYLNEIHFSEMATDGMDVLQDITSMEGGEYSFSMPVENSKVISNYLSPLTVEKTIPLQMNVGQSNGHYRFVFSGLESFEPGTQIYIRDMILGTITNITENPVYTFSVLSQVDASADRFELVFSPNGTTSTISVIKGIEMNLYPNPAEGNEVVLTLKGAVRGNGTWTISDVLGKTVSTGSLNLHDGINSSTLNVEKLSTGVYTLRVSTSVASFSHKLVIK